MRDSITPAKSETRVPEARSFDDTLSASVFGGHSRLTAEGILIPLLTGYLACYILFHIGPIYFDGAEQMRFMTGVPAGTPIGADLLNNVRKCARLIADPSRPWDAVVFSPFWTWTFGSLARFEPQHVRWAVVLLGLASFTCVCLWTPAWLSRRAGIRPAAVLVAAVGLSSYGVAFEFERAQWNLPVLLLCLGAARLWHTDTLRGRAAATAMYVVATHLKVWPIFFALCFIVPADGWKKNLKALAVVQLCNGLFLFCLGARAFTYYVRVSGERTIRAAYYWSGNHSIASFSSQLGDRFGLALPVAVAAYAMTVLAAVAVLYAVFSRKHRGTDPLLVLTCMLLSMLLPKISHDYKLSALTAATAVFFGTYRRAALRGSIAHPVESAVLTALAACFSVTLFAGAQKRLAGLPSPNTPFLVGMIACLGVLALLRIRSPLAARVAATSDQGRPSLTPCVPAVTSLD